jgi:protein ImuB
MYACIYTSNETAGDVLMSVALTFSPVVEQTSSNTVVFSIAPLRKLIGSPHQIASEICRVGYEHKLEANLAIASNPDTAILLARQFAGVTLVTPGEEKFKIAPIPIAALFSHDIPVEPKLLETLHRWGLKTCEDLAALPERGLAERLGASGVYLRNLACGTIERPLRTSAPVMNYEQRMELEYPLDLLKPLLFLLGSVLNDLCRRLRSQSMAARTLEAQFELEQHNPYHCELEFPVPLTESQTLLKLLQLHLERHPPEAAIVAFALRLEASEPKRVHGGIFLPPAPAADKLQITLARIGALVGKENVGTPRLLNTHRPDAFEMTAWNASAVYSLEGNVKQQSEPQQTLRLAMRLFRPALHARVHLMASAPKDVVAPGVKGKVIRCAGPWKTSGEWWGPTAWTREEWDVALDDGALYRIYQQMQTHDWYVHGVYD